LLDFVELKGKHSGERMAKVVYGVLKKHGLLGKISIIMSDNATSNDTMMAMLEDLFNADNIDFPVNERRGRCLPHIIHLAALSLLNALGAWPASTKAGRDVTPKNPPESSGIPPQVSDDNNKPPPLVPIDDDDESALPYQCQLATLLNADGTVFVEEDPKLDEMMDGMGLGDNITSDMNADVGTAIQRVSFLLLSPC
ncbi:hypothetical protein BT69DRAFT_1218907, partial [Atractiella rhizophila]